MDSTISIDINTSKLLDWLISRRHVKKDWPMQIIKVREKINNAIQDMPAHEGIVKLLSGQHINYFHCLKIVEILKETEADSKNLFGRYGSQRMKDWQDILSCYQKDNLYLAEAADILIRNAIYEVPSLRKQVLKLEETQLDCEKKINNYVKIEALAQSEFTTSCRQLGISGTNIRKELIQLVEELPLIYKKAGENMKGAQNALTYYKAFRKYHLGKHEEDSQVLPTLQYLITNGNTTVYEFIYGEKPVSVELPPLNIKDDEDNLNMSCEIDFGEEKDVWEGLEGGGGTVNFSDDTEIDYGIRVADEDFELIECTECEESGIVLDKSGSDGGGIAKGHEAYTIMDDPKTRDLLINELMELEAFLKLRLHEMSLEANLFSMSQVDTPTLLQMQSVKSILEFYDSVQIALNEFTNKRIQHLHNMKHSEKYVDMLANSLKQKLNTVKRAEISKQVLEDKIREMRTEAKNLGPVINKIIENTKILRKEIEIDISKKYKGQSVMITGSVNVM